MTYRDINAMSRVLLEEHQKAERARQMAKARKGR